MKCLVAILLGALLVHRGQATPFAGLNFDITASGTVTAGIKADLLLNAKVLSDIAPIRSVPSASADIRALATSVNQFVISVTNATSNSLTMIVAFVADRRSGATAAFAKLDATFTATLATYTTAASTVSGMTGLSADIMANFTAAVSSLTTEITSLQTTFTAMAATINALASTTTVTVNRVITTDVQIALETAYANILKALVTLDITTRNAVTIITVTNSLTAATNSAGTSSENTRAAANATIIPAINKLLTTSVSTLSAFTTAVRTAYDRSIARIDVFTTSTIVPNAMTTITALQGFKSDMAAVSVATNMSVALALTTEITTLTDKLNTKVATVNTTTVSAVNSILEDVAMGVANASICAPKVVSRILALETSTVSKFGSCLRTALSDVAAANSEFVEDIKVLQAAALGPNADIAICTSAATSASASFIAKITLRACLSGETGSLAAITTDIQTISTKISDQLAGYLQLATDRFDACTNARLAEFQAILGNLEAQYAVCLENSGITITRIAEIDENEPVADEEIIDPAQVVNVEIIDAKSIIKV